MMVLYWSLMVPVLFFGGALLVFLAEAAEETTARNRVEREVMRTVPAAHLSRSEYRRIAGAAKRRRTERRWGP